MISASSLERIEACPGSTTLPTIETPNEDASRGTAVHRFLQNHLDSRSLLDGVAEDYHDLCNAFDLSRFPRPGTLMTETAFAFDVVTRKARILDAKDRQYVIGPTEIPGTPDAIGLLPDAVLVVDWKGRWSKATQAAENLQLGFYAVCAAKFYGKDRAIVAIARISEDGPRYDQAELDPFDLLAMEDRIVETHRRAGMAKFSEGEHCRYCPGFNVCPAKMSLAQYVARPELLEAQVGVALEVMDDAARLEVWNRIDQVEEVIKRVNAAMRESIARKPIDCGDSMIVIGQEPRRSIDAAKAIELAPELATVAKTTLSITDAEKLLGKRGIDCIKDAIRTSKIEKVKKIKKSKLEGANK